MFLLLAPVEKKSNILAAGGAGKYNLIEKGEIEKWCGLPFGIGIPKNPIKTLMRD